VKEKKKKICKGFGYNWKKNSLGRGRNQGMAHKTRDEKQKNIRCIIE